MAENKTYTELFPSPEAWLRQQARSVTSRLLAAIGWSLAVGLLIIIQARLLATVCQQVVLDGVGLSPLRPLLAWLACVVLLRAVCVYLSEEAAISAAARVKQQVRSRLYQRLLQLKPGGQAGESGPLTELVTTGVEGLEAYIARFLPQMVLAGLLPLAMLVVVLPSEWRSSLVLIISAPFIPLLMVLIGKGTETLNRRQFGQLSRLGGHLLDLVQGLPDLNIFGAAKREAGLVAEASEQYRSATMKVLRVAFFISLYPGILLHRRYGGDRRGDRLSSPGGRPVAAGWSLRAAAGAGILPAAAEPGAVLPQPDERDCRCRADYAAVIAKPSQHGDTETQRKPCKHI